MYECLGWRTNDKSFAGRAARQTIRTVFSHRGDADDFLSRHRALCSELPHRPLAERQRVADHLLRVAADFRSLQTAWNKTADRPRAAGPDGIRQDDLPVYVRHQLFRMIGNLLEPGQYQASEPRRVDIPKPNGKTRPIDVANLADNLAGRTLAQAITPFLDPGLTSWCMGGRENHNREMALVWAVNTAERKNRWKCIAQDVSDAFPSVPRSRLWQVLRSRMLTPTTVEQIERLIGYGRKATGIPQGNPLSPFLLNIYLDQYLDRPWLKRHWELPIIRYIDDVLLLLTDNDDPGQIHDELAQMVQSAGMRLKHPKNQAIQDLSQGQAVEWIGYRISWRNGTWYVGVGGAAWDNLSTRLRDCHLADNPPLAAESVIQGWIGQQGACYHPETVMANVALVVQAAQAVAFGEIASPSVLQGLWEQAYSRFLARATVYRDCLPTYGAHVGCSADRQFTAIRGCRGGAGPKPVPPHLFAKPADFLIWTDGSALKRENGQATGGWAYVILNRHHIIIDQGSGWMDRTTNNRMELMAVVRALAALPVGTRIDLFTDSKYVIDSSDRARKWRQHNWHKTNGVVKNHDLIGEMLTLCEQRFARFSKVKAHSGNTYNEIVDREASRQATLGITQN